MKLPSLTLRARLTAGFLLLFVVLGGVLLGANYRLLESQLPEGASGSGSFAVGGASTLSSPSAGAGAGVGVGASPGADPSASNPVSSSVTATASIVDSAIHTYRSEALSRLVRISALSLAAGTVLAALLAWLVAERALMPLQRMNESARRISEQNLDERLPVPGPRDEVRDLSENLNASLERLQAAFLHERRLIASASHELGTPIANQRTVLEVALADPDISRDQLQQACRTALGQTLRSEALLTGMLTLARADQGPPAATTVDAAALVRTAVDQLAPHDVALSLEVEPTTIEADPFLLERLVLNLVRNAVTHNVPGGWARLELRPGEHAPRLVVTNSCAPLTSDQLSSLREPFRRASQDRVGIGTGSGLGLAIADSVARAHGWQLELGLPEPEVFRATVRLFSGP